MEQTVFYIVPLNIKEGFIVDGNKNRLYEKGDVFSYRTNSKPKITHGYLVTFPDGHIVFVDKQDCTRKMVDKTDKDNVFTPMLAFNEAGAKFWNDLTEQRRDM